MRKKGLEPPRREAPDPKSGAATNYATSAVGCLMRAKIEIRLNNQTLSCSLKIEIMGRFLFGCSTPKIKVLYC